MKTYIGDMHLGRFADLAQKIARLDSLGVDGYLHGDHVFLGAGGGGDGERSSRASHEAAVGADPYTVLAAVGALSQRLTIGTLVANAALCHPGLILRHFAQLAALYGGDRVLAGVGAGWNAEEFEALGLHLPPMRQRVDHLEATAQLARSWFDQGIATIDAPSFTAVNLPMAPWPESRPRLLLGGGGERLMRIAGRLADVVDLHPLRPRVETGHPESDEERRYLETTLDDARRCVASIEAGETDAGRQVGSVRRTMWVGYIEFCRSSERSAVGEQICRKAQLAPRDLRGCPYALVGEPADIIDQLAERKEVLGLDAVIVGLTPSLDRFVHDVMPHV